MLVDYGIKVYLKNNKGEDVVSFVKFHKSQYDEMTKIITEVIETPGQKSLAEDGTFIITFSGKSSDLLDIMIVIQIKVELKYGKF